VIDDLIVYTGICNHKKGGTETNDENYIIIKDIGIAHIYEMQFQKLWKKHK
jgi:phosphatidylserine/phosphatidylglycerophosphate/cardiolipin synthase-like enzyme